MVDLQGQREQGERKTVNKILETVKQKGNY